MKSLFISLYLDEDVDVLVARLLRVRGFSVTTTQEEGQLGASDVSQLAYAASQGRSVLTHNRLDFENLTRAYFEASQEHCGVIVAVRRRPHEMARRLLLLLNGVTADEMENQVRYI